MHAIWGKEDTSVGVHALNEHKKNSVMLISNPWSRTQHPVFKNVPRQKIILVF